MVHTPRSSLWLLPLILPSFSYHVFLRPGWLGNVKIFYSNWTTWVQKTGTRGTLELINVNAFLFYAERSRCGFRIRNITFGSSGTWISVLLGLFGFGLRLFQYIQWVLGQHPPNTTLPDWKMTDNPDPVSWITIIPSSCATSFSNAFSSNYFRF